MQPFSHQVIIRAENGQWLDFREPVAVLSTTRPAEIMALLEHIEREVEAKQIYAAGFVSYEAGAAFDPAFRFRPGNGFPLLWFGLFKRTALLRSLPRPAGPAWSPAWRRSVTAPAYRAAIAKIKAYIARGATYQVNYSFRLAARCAAPAREIFFQLAAGRDIPCAAFIETERFAVCSLSPELFFSRQGDLISSRPMKGTMPRGLMLADDERLARRLYLSEKNRAENVMIVDMVRNDLGRIAAPATVRVAALFDLEKHDTVWQMTSTVQARTSAALPRIFQALFPPASVTGAPKVNTMRIIAELETSPRRIYTGSIGYLAPGRRARFNVAIRTLLVDKRRGAAEYGVGGGVVWDSAAAAEYEECALKAGILRPQPEFSLLETMLWRPGHGYFLLERHMARLKSSAAYFSFPCDEKKVRARLAALAASFRIRPAGRPGRPARRVRLLLARAGRIALAAKIYKPQKPRPEPVVCLAKHAIAPANPFLYHKTTNRIVYAAARAACPGCDEVVLWNENGEVTEFCAGNIIVNLGGKLLTPPVRCGLLPGTYRARLLAEGRVTEAIIKREDLPRARAIYFCNSVRKMQKVRFLETGILCKSESI